jgi:hypothetical protein
MDHTGGLAHPVLPGVGLVTWTIPAVINWCLPPYPASPTRVVTLTFPVGGRLVMWTILAVADWCFDCKIW